MLVALRPRPEGNRICGAAVRLMPGGQSEWQVGGRFKVCQLSKPSHPGRNPARDTTQFARRLSPHAAVVFRGAQAQNTNRLRQPLPTLSLFPSKSRAIGVASRIQPCEVRAIHLLPFPARSQFLPGRLVEMGIRQTRGTHPMQAAGLDTCQQRGVEAARPRALAAKQPELTAGKQLIIRV
jgi:hypothetical protein